MVEKITKIKFCEKHKIEFEDKYLNVFGGMVKSSENTGCPKCAAEKLEETKRSQAASAEREAQRRVKVAIDNFELDVPRRFKHAHFDNYNALEARQNKAYSVIKQYLESFESKILSTGGGLILTGSTGTGKTHLSIALGREIAKKGHSVQYITLMLLIRWIRSTWTDDTQSETSVIRELRSKSLLIIDEVGVQAGSENERNILFEVINGRYEDVKPTIIISNLDRDQVATMISERSVDRITEGGAIIPFSWDSHRKGRDKS